MTRPIPENSYLVYVQGVKDPIGIASYKSVVVDGVMTFYSTGADGAQAPILVVPVDKLLYVQYTGVAT